MNTLTGTLAGVGPALFGQIQVLRNFDSLPISKMKLTLWPEQKCKGFWDIFELERTVICPLASVGRRILSWSFSGHCAQLKDIIKAILTFLSSWHCIFGSLCFEMLNWPLRAPLNTSAIIKARQTIDWTPVNSAPLHILSSPTQCPTRYWMPPRPSLSPPLSEATIWLALCTAVWERGMGGRRGRWGRTSKWVQFRTWAGMIKKGRLFTLHFPYGPSPPPPSRFPAHTSYLCGRDNSLARAPRDFSLLYIVGGAAAHSFAFSEMYILWKFSWCASRCLVFFLVSCQSFEVFVVLVGQMKIQFK